MTIKDRLLEFLNHLDIGQTRFEKETGLANAYIANMGKTPKRKTLQRITEKYPDFNLDWLMTGQGNMLLSTPASFDLNDADIIKEASFNVLKKIVLQREAREKNQTIRATFNDFDQDVAAEVEHIRRNNRN